MTALPVYDITARKTHQWSMLVLIALGFVLGDVWGWLPLAVAGAIMLLGRFWWPADVVRQLVWRIAEPAGWLPRNERFEDRATRRVARVLGGAAWLVAAALVLLGQPVLGWLLAGLIGVMVALDAAVDFCALCFIVALFDRTHAMGGAVRGER
jgi:hypothetical protein